MAPVVLNHPLVWVCRLLAVTPGGVTRLSQSILACAAPKPCMCSGAVTRSISSTTCCSIPPSSTRIPSAAFIVSRVAAFIDFNHDGIFDVNNGELVLGGATATGPGNNVVIDSVLIPSTALTGLTRMRVIVQQGAIIPDPCATYLYGETEDYLINILGDSPCSIPFTAGTAVSSPVGPGR